MTPDQYWYGDPQLFYIYKGAYENNRKLKEFDIWLTGAYIRSAINSSIFKADLVNKDTKIPDYPKNPLDKIQINTNILGGEALSTDEITNLQTKINEIKNKR